MTNEELKREIVAEIKGIQSKYIYYVISLNIAAVGYSIHHVQGQSFNWSHYLLGSAIILWSIGVFLEFQFLFNLKQVSHIAYNFLELFDAIVKTTLANVINTTIKSKIDAKSISLQERVNGYYMWSFADKD